MFVRARSKTFLAMFVLTALVAAMLAIFLGWPAPPAQASLKAAFCGYTNHSEPVFQLTNASSRNLQVGPYGWLITLEGQAFGSIPLKGPPGGLLPSHKTFTFSMPPPLCGHPWRAQFVAEPVGWKTKWKTLRAGLTKMGLPIGNSEMPSIVGLSEVLNE